MKISSSEICNLHIELDFAFNRKSTPGYGYNNKNLRHHNILYIYEGSGIFGNGSETRQVKKGDLVYFAQGHDQYMSTDPDNLLQLYTINFHAVMPMRNGINWSTEAVEFDFKFVNSLTDTAVTHQFIMLFERLAMLFRAGVNWKKAKQREIFLNILELADSCQHPTNISISNQKAINRTVYYMSEHYTEKITLEELAEIAGLSTSHYSALFRTVTGRSPIDYLIHLRIFNAKQFIMDGMPIAETAELVGFSDIYYFSRIFKKHDGSPPSSYLKKNHLH